jgi:hypothetical protein
MQLSPAEKLYFSELLKRADTDGDGFIGPGEAIFLRKSKIPDQILGKVLRISQINQLNKSRFGQLSSNPEKQVYQKKNFI